MNIFFYMAFIMMSQRFLIIYYSNNIIQILFYQFFVTHITMSQRFLITCRSIIIIQILFIKSFIINIKNIKKWQTGNKGRQFLHSLCRFPALEQFIQPGLTMSLGTGRQGNLLLLFRYLSLLLARTVSGFIVLSVNNCTTRITVWWYLTILALHWENGV